MFWSFVEASSISSGAYTVLMLNASLPINKQKACWILWMMGSPWYPRMCELRSRWGGYIIRVQKCGLYTNTSCVYRTLTWFWWITSNFLWACVLWRLAFLRKHKILYYSLLVPNKSRNIEIVKYYHSGSEISSWEHTQVLNWHLFGEKYVK